MNRLSAILSQAEALVNDCVSEINREACGLKDAEERVVSLVNEIGGIVVGEILARVEEPTKANSISVDGEQARFKGTERMRVLTRFGTVVERSRRRYTRESGGGGVYPLDRRVGVDLCGGYTPLMTYLLTLFGAGEAYEPAAERLSEALGVPVSAPAVQKNTERVGAQIERRPSRLIPREWGEEGCDLLVVEADGTTSPQIQHKPGICGRDVVRQPTEYKECNLVSFELRRGGELPRRWIGARYGSRSEFEQYLGEAACSIAQMPVKEVVFLADGARHNWEMQQTHFPEAVAILDVYHALEHLGEFCRLFERPAAGQQYYARWRTRILEGYIVRVIAEMKNLAEKLTNRDEGYKHINYFENNRHRMAYHEYRRQGYPSASGAIEGACKYVVGKRFKGSGMRWTRADNEATLNARLHVVNETLASQFHPKSPIDLPLAA